GKVGEGVGRERGGRRKAARGPEEVATRHAVSGFCAHGVTLDFRFPDPAKEDKPTISLEFRPAVERLYAGGEETDGPFIRPPPSLVNSPGEGTRIEENDVMYI